MKSYLRTFINLALTIFLSSLGTMYLFWSLIGCKEEVPTGIYDNIHDPQSLEFRPYSPTSLSLVAQSGSSVTLEWTDSSNYISGFLIQKRIAGGIFFDLAQVHLDVTQFRDTAVTQDIDYSYRVFALRDSSRSLPSRELSVGYRPVLTFNRTVKSPWKSSFWGGFSLSPDGRQMVIQDGTFTRPTVIAVIDIATGQVVKTFQRDAWSRCNPIFFPDGQSVLMGYSSATICKWSISTGQIVSSYVKAGEPFGTSPSQGVVESIDVSPDGSLLAAGIFDLLKVVVWDTRTGSIIQELSTSPNFYDGYPFVSFSPDGRMLAGVAYEGSFLWDVSNSTSRGLPVVNNELAYALSFNRSSSLLGWVSPYGSRICNVVNGQHWPLSGASFGVFMPDKPFYLISAYSGFLFYRLFDMRTVSTVPYSSTPMCFRVSPDGQEMYVNFGGGIDMWDVIYRWMEVQP